MLNHAHCLRAQRTLSGPRALYASLQEQAQALRQMQKICRTVFNSLPMLNALQRVCGKTTLHGDNGRRLAGNILLEVRAAVQTESDGALAPRQEMLQPEPVLRFHRQGLTLVRWCSRSLRHSSRLSAPLAAHLKPSEFTGAASSLSFGFCNIFTKKRTNWRQEKKHKQKNYISHPIAMQISKQ